MLNELKKDENKEIMLDSFTQVYFNLIYVNIF